jgi:hypothetical protein
MINHFEFVSFPVGIRHLKSGQGGYQKTPVAAPPKAGESSTINSI